MLFLAFLWGFAEATFFFIVPDVIISFLAVRDLKTSLIGSVLAALGALVGGAIMYDLGKKHPSVVLSFVEKIPAISWGMIRDVENQVESVGVWAMFKGAFSGVPYKVYASVYGAKKFPFLPFIIFSFPARLLRFVLIAIIFYALSLIIPQNLHIPLLVAGWIVFYALFWYFMPW